MRGRVLCSVLDGRRWLLLSLVLAVAGGVLAAAQDDLPEVVRTLLDAAARQEERGRTDEAIASYREAIRLAPEVVAAYSALGALYHREGDLEAALGAFARGLGRAPEDRNLLYNAAVVSLALDRAEDAERFIERAADAHPRDADLHLFHGAVLRRLGKAEASLAAIEKSRALSPRDARVLFALGNARHELGRLEESIDAYREAVKRDKSMLRAHYNLGAVLFELGRFDEAEEAYELALRPFDQALAAGRPVEGIHATAYRNLGAIFVRQKAWRRALDAYGKAVRLDPSDAAGHYHLGYVLYELGDFDAASASYRAALKLEEDLPLAYLHLAKIGERRGEPAEVIRWLEAGLARLEGEERRQGLLLAAAAYESTGDGDAAEASYRAVLDVAPEHVAALLGLGRRLRRAGRPAEARPVLEKALAAAPESPGVGLELAALARAEGDPEGERALYEKVLASQGDRPELRPVRVNLALVLLQQGETDAARKQLEALLPARGKVSGEAAGEDPAVTAALRTAYGVLLAGEGQRQEAAEQLRAVLAADSGYAPAAEGLAVLEALAGRPGPAAEALSSRLASQDGAGGADEASRTRLRANLGQVLWLAGRPAEAESYLREAAAAFPDWIAPRVALGEIALAAGDSARAAEQLTAASRRCAAAGAGVRALPPAEGRVFQLTLASPEATRSLCDRARRGLGRALVARAHAALAAGREAAAVADLAERALDLPLAVSERSLALFARGTARLMTGRDEEARQDIEAALGGSLPADLAPLARNNLGVALYRLGRVAEARRQLEAAREAADGPNAATLNLGVALDEQGTEAEGAEALRLYEAYLARAGARRREVEGWVEALRRFYP